MTKSNAILFASIFTVSALLATSGGFDLQNFGYNVDAEQHASLNPEEIGYSVDVEQHASLDEEAIGYTVDEELHS